MPRQRPPLAKRSRVLGTLLIGAFLVGAGMTSHAATPRGVFGSTEIRNENLTPFPKWLTMLERYLEERKTKEGSCEETTFNKCHYQRWQQLIESLQGKSKRTQLKAVNDYANQAIYIIDPINWGVKDYWASPGQFFIKDGDCEDYAILKFLTLRRLGFTNDELRIVVLQDLDLRIAHAVLAVYDEHTIKILDNQMTLVVEDRRIRHYRPIYSINENAWWRHKPAR